MRRTADGRLQFGAGGWPGRGNPPLAETWLRRALRKALPDLAQAKIARAWSGLVDVTTDGMPRFADREGLIHLVGFCGHGVALTTLAGEIVANAIEGEDADFRRFAALPANADLADIVRPSGAVDPRPRGAGLMELA